MNPVEFAKYTTYLVAGQTEQRMNDVAARFQSGGSQVSATQVIVVLVIVAIIAVVLWRVARVAAMRDGRSFFSSKRLFQELCQLHELDWASRRLLRRLAHRSTPGTSRAAVSPASVVRGRRNPRAVTALPGEIR